jgi:hypothetical protein
MDTKEYQAKRQREWLEKNQKSMLNISIEKAAE